MKNNLSLFLSLVVLPIIANCSQTDEKFGPADTKGLVVQKIVIGDDNFEILLPKKYTMQSTLEDKAIFTIPDTRNVHYLRISNYSTISTRKKNQIQKWEHSIPMREGSGFQFSIKHNIGTGSGGTEGELTGVVRLDQAALNIECRDQNEWRPKPEWCVPYIHHLRFQGR